MENKDLIPFEGEPIRKVWHDGQWYFSVVDIVGALTDSPIPRNYWSDLKRRESQLHENCVRLKLTASDGRQRLTDCAHTEGVGKPKFCDLDFHRLHFVRLLIQ